MNTKHTLGTILQAAGLLNPGDVEKILKAQAKSQETGEKYLPFGEIALHLKLVTVHQLRAALEIQKRLVFPNDEAKRLGFYLLTARLVKPDALVQALEQQRSTQHRLEKVLLDRQMISPEVLQSVLKAMTSEAAERPPAPPAPSPQVPPPPRKPPTLDELLRENHKLRELVMVLRRENTALKERLAQKEPTP